MNISVVIPTHNRKLELKSAILSVFNQTILPTELIVVDDCSDEELTDDIFHGAPLQLKCILLRNVVPLGGNYARNRGVSFATGEYIAFLDDDDEFFTNKIEVVKNELVISPEVDLFYHIAEIHMVIEGVKYFSKPKKFDKSENIFKSLLINNWIGGTPMVIVKKSSLQIIGSFNEQMPALQDYELWLRMAKAKMSFKFIDKPLTKYNYFTKKHSVSKSFKINEEAIRLIETKFKSEYSSLSKREIRTYNEYKTKNIIHRLILNGSNVKALIKQVNQFLLYPHPENFIKIFVILIGTKFIFLLKSKGL